MTLAPDCTPIMTGGDDVGCAAIADSMAHAILTAGYWAEGAIEARAVEGLRVNLDKHTTDDLNAACAIRDLNVLPLSLATARKLAKANPFTKGERKPYVVRMADDTIALVSFGSRGGWRTDWVFFKA